MSDEEPPIQKHDDALSKRKELGGIPFRDMAGEGMPEDDRITRIGEAAMSSPGMVAALVDAKPEAKATRYAAKIEKRFPALECTILRRRPIPEVTTIQVRRRIVEDNN